MFNVQRCGAIGNGIHGDTVAIQTAINVASVSGRQVFFPSTFKTNSGYLTIGLLV